MFEMNYATLQFDIWEVLYHGIVKYPFLIGLKGILERALFPYNAQYICTVQFNGYSLFLQDLFELLLNVKVKLKTVLVLLIFYFIFYSKLGLTDWLAKLASLFVWIPQQLL